MYWQAGFLEAGKYYKAPASMGPEVLQNPKAGILRSSDHGSSRHKNNCILSQLVFAYGEITRYS
jgi:hypothetical protein